MLVDLETPNAMERERWADLMRAYPQAPILALVTSATTDIARQCATTAGALGCVAKDRGATEFAVNLEAALRRAVGAARERTLRPFTVREREILLLIADGLTNPAIAQRLVVSEKTVKRHVSTILEKLGVDNRVRVACWAWEHGLASRRDNNSSDKVGGKLGL
jgi:DNA-binding NarL/FixJ family response regulator